ncbi:hypothetical protein J3A83DRAFT_435169 [Scleroderma citrinum]
MIRRLRPCPAHSDSYVVTDLCIHAHTSCNIHILLLTLSPVSEFPRQPTIATFGPTTATSCFRFASAFFFFLSIFPAFYRVCTSICRRPDDVAFSTIAMIRSCTCQTHVCVDGKRCGETTPPFLHTSMTHVCICRAAHGSSANYYRANNINKSHERRTSSAATYLYLSQSSGHRIARSRLGSKVACMNANSYYKETKETSFPAGIIAVLRIQKH